MTGAQRTVASIDELTTALVAPGVASVTIAGSLNMVPTLALRPGQYLVGATGNIRLCFAPGADGGQLSTDNALTGLTLELTPGAAQSSTT